jgi:aspartyl-tRNA(Asn)/glutamyl-tRNA(Gln) amidotransferase subunit A
MHTRTLAELAEALRTGDTCSEELTRHFLARIESLDPQLNAFITVTSEQALEAARAADRARAAGEAGPLTGIPLAHKDIFCTEGVKTSCGSRMLDNFVSPYDATVVAKLKAAGGVMLGKTNMDEFAMGSSNETSWYGPVRNPWDLSKVPGGSSGGSAAAVAARLIPAATGTDTGGSIRQPAALTGTTGLKPTYGRVSRYGMIAFASSLDQAGTITASAEDAALLLEIMAGHDPRDSTSVDVPVERYSQALENPLRGLRVGVVEEFFDEGLDSANGAAIEAALKVYEDLGATVKRVSLPNLALSVPAYYVVAPAECSSNLSRYDGIRFGYRADDPKDVADLYKRSRGEGFGAEVKRRIMTATYVLSAGYYDAYYLRAQKVRTLIRRDFEKAFADGVNAILAPTTPSAAFEIGSMAKASPVEMYLNDIFTVTANMAGLPGISVPAGADRRGLPLGLQLIGRAFDEETLFAAGQVIEDAAGHFSPKRWW